MHKIVLANGSQNWMCWGTVRVSDNNEASDGASAHSEQ
jgi:hypothetical protein